MASEGEGELITFLEYITAADFARILTRFPDTANRLPDLASHKERVAAFISYVRSAHGPGMESLRDVVGSLFYRNFVFKRLPLSKFSSISVRNWRHFRAVVIELHDRLTIITGSNAAGKSTILKILGAHIDLNNVVGTHISNRRHLISLGDETVIWTPHSLEEVGFIDYGEYSYPIYYQPDSNDDTGSELIYTSSELIIKDATDIKGIYISSYRPNYNYEEFSNITARRLSSSDTYRAYVRSVNHQMYRIEYPGQSSYLAPLTVIKDALISLTVYSSKTTRMNPHNESLKMFQGFQEILRKILPSKIGFENLVIDVPDVLLETATGTFRLDAISGGMASLIDIAWRIFMYSPSGDQFVCIIDEPENHLHPELQQSLLPNLLAAFPNVQFIVATHSPHMVTAVRDSNVYVLDFDEEGKVGSVLLDTVNKAGTANEILRNVLGLPFTTPLWAEKQYNEIVNKYEHREPTDENVEALEKELTDAGLSNFVPMLDGDQAELSINGGAE